MFQQLEVPHAAQMPCAYDIRYRNHARSQSRLYPCVSVYLILSSSMRRCKLCCLFQHHPTVHCKRLDHKKLQYNSEASSAPVLPVTAVKWASSCTVHHMHMLYERCRSYVEIPHQLQCFPLCDPFSCFQAYSRMQAYAKIICCKLHFSVLQWCPNSSLCACRRLAVRLACR